MNSTSETASVGKACAKCRGGTEGFDFSQSPFLEELARMDVDEGCGCGGETTHFVLRCAECGSYYGVTSVEHKMPDSYSTYVYVLKKEDAEKLVAELSACGKGKRCDCPAHKAATDLNMGQRFGIRHVSQSYWSE